MTTVRIPSGLRTHADGRRSVDATGDTVDAVLRDVVGRYPGLAAVLLGTGPRAPTCNIYVNGTDIRQLDGLATPVADDAVVVVLLAMGGGG